MLKIKDSYSKILTVRTRHKDYTYEGVIIKDIANWFVKINNFYLGQIYMYLTDLIKTKIEIIPY